jgi:hypothetical protein
LHMSSVSSGSEGGPGLNRHAARLVVTIPPNSVIRIRIKAWVVLRKK